VLYDIALNKSRISHASRKQGESEAEQTSWWRWRSCGVAILCQFQLQTDIL